ncbi:hypothetical protein EVAR_7803_1 [Eumeta japonica]|uniref:Uncharacterized protein n=1 Tax=Eumeta variegata TaxID=151549 RepID=A0A4C1TKF1_EUMVA|nr:hypothetical protein EVAR_7803_1 [Eumeta japonica]
MWTTLPYACAWRYMKLTYLHCKGGGRSSGGGGRSSGGGGRSSGGGGRSGGGDMVIAEDTAWGSNAHGSGVYGSRGSHSHPSYGGGYGTGYGSRQTYNTYGHGYGYVPYTYHSAPQTVYIHEYRNTGSRYSDILSGLALYNLGRSHSHHYHHYYKDDYYTRRYEGTNRHPYDAPNEKAKCYLRLSEEGKEQKLSVPCEIVSTFTGDSEKVEMNTTMVDCKNVTMPAEIADRFDTNKSNFKFIDLNALLALDLSDPQNFDQVMQMLVATEPEGARSWRSEGLVTTSPTTETATLVDLTLSTSTTQRTPEDTSVTSSLSDTSSTVMTNATTGKELHIRTICPNATSTDPLMEKGQKVEVTSKMKCTVEIETSTSLLRHKVDCKTLEAYSKMPEPKKENTLTPSRNTLKSWMYSPPWWLSLFIAL